MGNRVFRARRNAVEERYTRPQRILRQPSNIDYKKLRKLILSQKLAPCFDGVEDNSNSSSDLEECPICFFFYPSLNRSRCCSKGICTECFLQMNPSNAIRPAQCPFCKYSSYAVEYRGAKSEEEKGLEQAEEQKVIEAKIRMQFQESQTTDHVTSANRQLCPVEVQYPTECAVQNTNAGWMQDVGNSNLSLQGRGIEASQFPFPNALNERHAEFGLNFDEVMLMEAIWQSIQNRNTQQFSEPYTETYGSNQPFPYVASTEQEELPSSTSITGGVASAIARLAETNILQDEHFIEHQIGQDSEFYEANENECLASCSTTEDNSQGGSEDEFLSEEDLVKEGENDDTSSCSSLHTISEESCGSESPICEIYGSQSSSLLQGPVPGLMHQRSFTQYCS